MAAEESRGEALAEVGGGALTEVGGGAGTEVGGGAGPGLTLLSPAAGERASAQLWREKPHTQLTAHSSLTAPAVGQVLCQVMVCYSYCGPMVAMATPTASSSCAVHLKSGRECSEHSDGSAWGEW